MPTLHDCHEVINENFIRSGNQPKYVKSALESLQGQRDLI